MMISISHVSPELKLVAEAVLSPGVKDESME